MVRIAYDGPALSGKTTSIKALSSSLRRSVYSADEAEGRTLWFDWMDYSGGRFEGYEIRCQVVSVPGQQVLDARRKALLRGADAVVFVADSTTEGMNESVQMFRALQRWLGGASPPPPARVIVQVNKRDAPGCVALEDVRSRLGEPSLAITESVATDGTGVRETFIFAVRLALDRVRELIHDKALKRGRPEIDSGDELLRQLRSAEPAGGGHAGTLAGDLRAVIAAEVPPAALPRAEPADGVPHVPGVDVPSGLVWPPISGRTILKSAGSFAPSRSAEGDWSDCRDRWTLHSYRDALYGDLESGRQALIRWAHAHTCAGALISQSRCIVLCETGWGQWRLWQIVRNGWSLDRLLFSAIALDNLSNIAGFLVEGARAIVQAARTMEPEWFGAGGIAGSIVPTVGGVEMIGRMPRCDAAASTGIPALVEPRPLLRRELREVVGELRSRRAGDVPSIISALRRIASDPGRRETADTLVMMLLE